MDAEDHARRAQELVYEAWESDDADRRLILGQRALELDVDCADAFLLLAESAENLLERADLCRQAVDAGRRSLGLCASSAARKRLPTLGAGDYWLVLETRPYMRARYRLAETLAELGLIREAASHYRELCELNPADNQGARHRLAELLLELEEDQELAELLSRYADERSPVFFHYTRALLAYRLGERQQADEALDAAVALNPHVPAFLWGDRPLPTEMPETFSLGDVDEAACYVLGTQGAWLGTTGALRWLQQIAAAQHDEDVHDGAPLRPSPAGVGAAAANGRTVERELRRAELELLDGDAVGAWAAADAFGADLDPMLPGARTAGRAQSRERPRDVELNLEGPGAEVAELLHASLAEAGIEAELCARALELWAAYATQERPTIRKAAIQAAAFEYVFLRLSARGEETQASLAQRYGVSPSSLSRATQAINDWVDRELAEDEPLDLEAEIGASAIDTSTIDMSGIDMSGIDMSGIDASTIDTSTIDTSGIDTSGSPAVVPLDDETVAELSVLPRVDEHWSGALRPVPFQVMEPRLHRPTLAVWYDEGHAAILAQELYGPTVPDHALSHTLLQAFYAPLTGEPRLPASVRVEEDALAEQLRGALAPLGVHVEAGPLAAIGELMQSLESFLSRSSDASYLDNEVSTQHVASFFAAAATLRRAASWTFVSEGQVLGLDLDRFGLGRVCVSVVGSSGFERGLLIFRELDDYLRYFRHAAMSELDGALVGAPVELLSLLFEHGADLEPSLRREVFKHGWEVVGPEDYPLLLSSDGDGGTSELELDDYRLATICAEAVAVFCERHHRLFCGEERGPIRERVPLEHADGLESIYVVAPHPVQ
jgi:tetratricopeptide (TPR) repeat protein